jgi:hypothetical protein
MIVMKKPLHHQTSLTSRFNTNTIPGLGKDVRSNEARIKEAVEQSVRALAEERRVSSYAGTPLGRESAKVRPVAKAKVEKPKPTQQQATIPKLPKAGIATDKVELIHGHYNYEEVRWAAWWHMKTDPTKGEYPSYRGIKVSMLPATQEQRELGRLNTIESDLVRRNQRDRRAVGITPSADTKKGWMASTVPHHSTPEFQEIFETQAKSYRKELINRYLVQRSVDLAFDKAWGYRNIHDFIHEDTFPTVIEVGADTSELSSIIANLEQEIDAGGPQMLVDAVVADHLSQDAATKLMEQSIYDSHVDPTPSAANDVSVDDIPSHQEQRAGYIHTGGKLEVYDLDALAYDQWLRKQTYKEEESLYEYNIPKQVWENEAFLKEEGLEYLQYLQRFRYQFFYRERSERARMEADPMYEMRLGTYIHPLAQSNTLAFNKLLDWDSLKRSHAIEDGLIVPNCTVVDWHHYLAYEFNELSIPETPLTQPIVTGEQADIRKRVSSIIDEVLSDLTSTDDEAVDYEEPPWDAVTGVPNGTENTITSQGDLEDDQSPEVVDLASFRQKRVDDVKSVVSLSKDKLNSLSERDRELLMQSISTINDVLGKL